MIEYKLKLKFYNVVVALASCDHQKSKLRAVTGAEGFWVAELRVRQLKIGSKSCFGIFLNSKHISQLKSQRKFPEKNMSSWHDLKTLQMILQEISVNKSLHITNSR